jgi:hypothetical protein
MAKKRRFADGGDIYSEIAKLKEASERGKEEAIRESGLDKSKDSRDIELVKGIRRDKAADTGTMHVTRPGYGRRIDSATGKPTGPEMRRNAKGDWEGMKKGGAVKSSKGDGIAQRGRTKGRFI